MTPENDRQGHPRVVPVVPMKPLSECKTRLSRVMGPQERADLTMGMLRRTLLAIRGADADPFWVVGGDERIRNLARTLGATWMEDLGRNLNDTVTRTFESARLRGVSALYLPGDLPFIKPADIHQLVRSGRTPAQCNPVPRPAGRRHQRHPGALRSDTLLPPRAGQQQLPQARRHRRANGRVGGVLLQLRHGI